MFLLGSYRRLEQYRAVAGLALAAPGRWPKLVQLMRGHQTVFLTWNTIAPAAVALALLLANTAATRLVLPHAALTAAEFAGRWTLLVAVPFGLAMSAVDVYFLVRVAAIDRKEVEGYFDQAEHWLRSWHAPAVRVLSFGRIDPRAMVNEQVQAALVSASDLLNRSLWWTALQAGLRVAFGLTLWLTWATGEPG